MFYVILVNSWVIIASIFLAFILHLAVVLITGTPVSSRRAQVQYYAFVTTSNGIAVSLWATSLKFQDVLNAIILLQVIFMLVFAFLVFWSSISSINYSYQQLTRKIFLGSFINAITTLITPCIMLFLNLKLLADQFLHNPPVDPQPESNPDLDSFWIQSAANCLGTLMATPLVVIITIAIESQVRRRHHDL